MLTQGDSELAGFAAGNRLAPMSPQLGALSSTLAALAAVSDQVTIAVQRHDRLALEASNARADELMGEVARLSASLSAEDRALIGETGIAAICEQLAVGARRNAYLIEQAWAVDAALMRMLVGIGKVPAGGTGYGEVPSQQFVDRQA
jgi:hypothetical protein